MRIRIFPLGRIEANCYLVWNEKNSEALIIDPGGFSAAVEKEIADNGLKLKYILLTHGHFDHVEGIESFTDAYPDAKLAAGEKIGLLLDSPKPEIELKDGDTVSLGDLSLLVIKTPGHSECGVCFYTEESDPTLTEQSFSGTVFTGDTLFQLSVGRTDLMGGNFNLLKDSIKTRLLTLPDDTLVLPGHMGPTMILDEKLYNPFVK